MISRQPIMNRYVHGTRSLRGTRSQSAPLPSNPTARLVLSNKMGLGHGIIVKQYLVSSVISSLLGRHTEASPSVSSSSSTHVVYNPTNPETPLAHPDHSHHPKVYPHSCRLKPRSAIDSLFVHVYLYLYFESQEVFRSRIAPNPSH